MSWVSSVRLRDYYDELTQVTLTENDAVPILSDNILRRVNGINESRYFQNLTGPIFSYDTRYWNGAALTVERTGTIDWVGAFDLDITRTTIEGTTRQFAEVDATPVGFDWQSMGGAPDDAAITVVMALQGTPVRGTSMGQSEVIVDIDGDFRVLFRAFRYTDGSSQVRMLFEDGLDQVDIVNSVDLDEELWNSVVVATLDLPDNASSAIYVDEVAQSLNPTLSGGYDTGPPYPSHEDVNAAINSFNVYLGRDQVAKTSGRFESGYAVALYRGTPSVTDLDILQQYYKLPFET